MKQMIQCLIITMLFCVIAGCDWCGCCKQKSCQPTEQEPKAASDISATEPKIAKAPNMPPAPQEPKMNTGQVAKTQTIPPMPEPKQ